MKGRKWILIMLCIGGCALTYADDMGMNTNGDCSSFSVMEQDFASGLSTDNKDMFCTRFNQSQRNSAMRMTQQPDMNGNLLSPDEAVEKVAKDNRIMPMRKKSRGCPIQ
jgi:hypothetical protein